MTIFPWTEPRPIDGIFLARPERGGCAEIADHDETAAQESPGERIFDPFTSARPFVIGLSDYAAFVLLPRLTAHLEREGPEISIIVCHTGYNTGLSLLEDGVVELIAGNFPSPPSHMREERLYEEHFVCAARPGHPAFAPTLSIESYLSSRYLQISTSSDPKSYIDGVLKREGLQRNVVVTASLRCLLSKGPILLLQSHGACSRRLKGIYR